MSTTGANNTTRTIPMMVRMRMTPVTGSTTKAPRAPQPSDGSGLCSILFPTPSTWRPSGRLTLRATMMRNTADPSQPPNETPGRRTTCHRPLKMSRCGALSETTVVSPLTVAPGSLASVPPTTTTDPPLPV